MLDSAAPYLLPFRQHEGGALGQEMQCSLSGGVVLDSPQPSVPASRHNGSKGSCPGNTYKRQDYDRLTTVAMHVLRSLHGLRRSLPDHMIVSAVKQCSYCLTAVECDL